jgi:hypothetical protein
MADAKENPSLPDETMLWRYMSFPRFLSLLKNGLFFSTIANLRASDPYEGTVFPNQAKAFADNGLTLDNETIDRFATSLREGFGKLSSRFSGGASLREEKAQPVDLARATLVNCWTMKQSECVLMWKAYCPTGGVAVQTTFGKMCGVFDEAAVKASIALMRYDLDSQEWDGVKELPMFTFRLMQKRRWYQGETEFRLIIRRSREIAGSGEYVKVNVGKLIESVRVDPTAEDVFVDHVREIVAHHGLGATVSKSPIFSVQQENKNAPE